MLMEEKVAVSKLIWASLYKSFISFKVHITDIRICIALQGQLRVTVMVAVLVRGRTAAGRWFKIQE